MANSDVNTEMRDLSTEGAPPAEREDMSEDEPEPDSGRDDEVGEEGDGNDVQIVLPSPLRPGQSPQGRPGTEPMDDDIE